MAGNLSLPLVDLSNPDRAAAAKTVRQACIEHGFFYLINHGIVDSFIQLVFEQSKKFFSLSLEEKTKLPYNEDYCGYTAMYSEKLDVSSEFKGDLKESFYIGPIPAASSGSKEDPNQWPQEEVLPSWRATMKSYHEKILNVARNLAGLVALALDLDESFFEEIGALHDPMGFIRLLHYPGELSPVDFGKLGASAHSDYGMITLLATDGVPGLQICREKDKRPQLWENVLHLNGAFIVNVGDMLERWTNCLFRSTLHRVIAIGQERYSIAFFLDPNSDCLVECLESCCSHSNPPRFPPIRSGDYLAQRIKATYS